MMTPDSSPLVVLPALMEDFLAQVRSRNPFTDNRVNGPSPDDIDAETLQQAAFERLTNLAWEAHQTQRGLGAVLWGEAGIGKSHVLSRLSRWADDQDRALFIYIHNLQASPANLPRTVLRAVIGGLTQGHRSRFQQTPLFTLVRNSIRRHAGPKRAFQTWAHLYQIYKALLHDQVQRGPVDAAMVDRTVQDVVFQFFRSVMRTSQRKEDGTTASLAVRWLSGDVLDAEQARLLGLSGGRNPDAPIMLEDNQQIKQVLVTLSRLAAGHGQPFLLCFDQIDNLEDEQIAALSRFLEATIDGSPNLLVVASGIQTSLLGSRERQVIQDSAWDRLAQFEILLGRLTPPEARQLIAARLHRFLAPYVSLPQVAQLTQRDSLFPLGSEWFDYLWRDRTEARPRELLNKAREAWYHEQQALANGDPNQWLNEWEQRHGRTPIPAPALEDDWTPEQLQQAMDRLVNDRLHEQQQQSLHALSARSPDRETIKEIVHQLLEECRVAGDHYGLVAIERQEKGKTGPARVYDLLVHHQESISPEETQTGLVFAFGLSAYSAYHLTDELMADTSPPQRLLLFADDQGLPLGPEGENQLQQLRSRSSCELRILPLSLAEAAHLEALLAVRHLGRSEDLELTLPNGQVHLVTEAEVIASYHRQGRFAAAPVLAECLAHASGELLPVPVEPPGEADNEVIPTTREDIVFEELE